MTKPARKRDQWGQARMSDPEPGSIAATKPPAATVHSRELKARALFKALCRYDRTAFIELLSLAAACAPSEQALIDLAEAHPDRYVTGVLKPLAGVAGFTTDRVATTLSGAIDLDNLSDSQLRDRLASVLATLRQPGVVDIEATPVAELEPSAVAAEQHPDVAD